MRAPAQPKATPRTVYYEMLGCEKSATEQDLKKAYKRKALILHPDKQGGNGEPFKKMKYAYDVLMDPKKRSAYDRYGEPGVKFVEGNLSQEAAMQLFLSLGCCERLFLISLITIIIGYLCLFPVLLCMRWDHPKELNFAHVFLPIWVGLGLLLPVCICCVPSPTFPEPEEEDEHLRREIEEQQQQTINQVLLFRWGGVGVILLLSLMLLVLVLRLDGYTGYFLVIWPWILLELSLIAYKVWTAESMFVMTGHDPEILKTGKWSTKDWNLFILAFASPHVFYMAFAFVVALKLDGMAMSWWEVFAPLWVEWGFGTILALCTFGRIKSQDDMVGMSPEERMHQETCGTFVSKLILRCIWLGFLVLLCWKLVHPSSFPAWIIFLPIFGVAGCFCCCLSCFLCCMSAESLHEADDEETGGVKPQAPVYGSM